MSNYFQSSFQISQCHLEGCNINIASSNQQINHLSFRSLFSIGNDDVICQYYLDKDPKIHTISNPNSHQFTQIQYNATKEIFAVAIQSGAVLQLQKDSDTYTVDSSKTLYKSLTESDRNKVRSLKFTQNGQFLIIATNEPYCIVYDWRSKKFFKHKLESQTEILSIAVDQRNQYFCTIDFDGKAIVYEIESDENNEKMEIQNKSDSQDPFVELNAYYKQKSMRPLCSYKITKANSPIFKNNPSIMASFNYAVSLMTETLYLPGQTVLQKLELSLPPAIFTLQYQLCNNISHMTEIHQVVWLKHENCGLLLTGTEIEASIWHETKSEKLMNFNLDATFGAGKLIKNICVRKFPEMSDWGFAIIFKSRSEEESIPSKVYDFKAFQELGEELAKIQAVKINEDEEKPLEIEKLQESNKGPKKKSHKVSEQSISSKLLTQNLDFSLSTAYQSRLGDKARFLFYNNVGCIIERFDAKGDSIIELQMHDRSKISRMKIPPEMIAQYFALCPDTVVYASNSKVHVQCEKHLKEGYQWEYQWEEIEAVAIGGDWICAVNKNEIKVWDWVGNQLHSVAFDRRFMCMAAYEDLLVIVYHSSLPMWGAQSYKMLIFEVTSKTMKCIRDTMMPSTPTVSLKWFGFSEEGMLFCKDEGENLRGYMFARDEWIPVNSYDPLIERLFIQHIQNYEIFGFKLDQKFPSDPRVLPRSLPRKEIFDLTDFKLDYLSAEENEYIKKHKLSLMWLEHEKFRNARWYKLKYCMNKENRWHARMENIKSEEDIKASQAQLDLKLLDYFKKYLKLNRNLEDANVWKKVLLLCSSLAFYNETRSKLKEILEESEIRNKPRRELGVPFCHQYNREIPSMKKTSLCQLDRLEQMMGLRWLKLDQRNQQMEIQR